ncbi:hypothetical protein [Actinomadura opuntiae]|uniref:hypothetical protein n=1 Tax=Actinomadura sp. OS1-43 TaxID=604315 RepID=UPI00255AB75E|nr:hypothetical protein [Actinomadura sp. OS1-43]MDL4820042.1 hypothetical protein [Actinomadura sp. OS1-43]
MSQTWTTISDGGPERPAVLAVDFDATGRAEATFRELVESFTAALPVRLCGQPPAGHREDLPPAAYLDWWADGAPERVGAVLGYCAGSLFACALADVLAERRGSRPAVVLFNPGRPDVRTIRRDFDGIVGTMPALEPRERAAFHARAADLAAGTPDAFDEVADAILGLYGEASRLAFRRAGVDDDVGAELVAVFRSYVSYLRAARRIEYRPEWAAETTLVSRDHAPGPEFGRTPIWAGSGRDRLLADPDVAAAVHRLLSTAS